MTVSRTMQLVAEGAPVASASEKSGDAMTVAVILPAHNEAAHIGGVIASIPAFVDAIIVVDDASTDGTAEVARATGDPRVEVLVHETNAGVGGAMRTGYRRAIERRFDLAVKMDADGQMRADELERLIEPIRRGNADYTKGNRFYLRGATRAMPARRNFGNQLLSFMTKIASGYWHVYDPQCGFTVVRTAVLRLLDLDHVASDYFFEDDMLIGVNALGARVVDVPISTVYGAETSGVSIARVAFTFPPRLLYAMTARFWRKHLVTDFGAISVLTLGGVALTVFGVVFGGYHWYLSRVTDHVTTTGTVMIAVLPIIVGIQAMLQALVLSVIASPGAAETRDYVRTLIAEGRLFADEDAETPAQ